MANSMLRDLRVWFLRVAGPRCWPPSCRCQMTCWPSWTHLQQPWCGSCCWFSGQSQFWRPKKRFNTKFLCWDSNFLKYSNYLWVLTSLFLKKFPCHHISILLALSTWPATRFVLFYEATKKVQQEVGQKSDGKTLMETDPGSTIEKEEYL